MIFEQEIEAKSTTSSVTLNGNNKEMLVKMKTGLVSSGGEDESTAITNGKRRLNHHQQQQQQPLSNKEDISFYFSSPSSDEIDSASTSASMSASTTPPNDSSLMMNGGGFVSTREKSIDTTTDTLTGTSVANMNELSSCGSSVNTICPSTSQADADPTGASNNTAPLPITNNYSNDNYNPHGYCEPSTSLAYRLLQNKRFNSSLTSNTDYPSTGSLNTLNDRSLSDIFGRTFVTG
jgi:hypothetical protein